LFFILFFINPRLFQPPCHLRSKTSWKGNRINNYPIKLWWSKSQTFSR